MKPLILSLLSILIPVTLAFAENRDAKVPEPYNNRLRPDQLKRYHPFALKLVVQGRNEEALAFLREHHDLIESHPDTKLITDVALGRSEWKLDAATWPRERALPHRLDDLSSVGSRFSIAFGGGAGYVPQHERMWTTIASFDPTAMFLLGDNVYHDEPLTPQLQWYHYLRRQSQPEWRAFASETPIYAIWDDHDFSTDDSWGGPEIDHPAWKREVWEIFKANWDNPYYGGGDANPGVWFDVQLGDVHFILLDGRYYREDPSNPSPSMLGAFQMQWLKQTLRESRATFKMLSSPVPWAENVKPGSLDTWDGFPAERQSIYDFLAENEIEGVVLLSADRHRSDAYRIERADAYPLYEFSSSRLTNQHVHDLMPHSLIGYNEKQSFGLLEFDTQVADPSVTYTIINIDGEKIDSITVRRSQLDRD